MTVVSTENETFLSELVEGKYPSSLDSYDVRDDDEAREEPGEERYELCTEEDDETDEEEVTGDGGWTIQPDAVVCRRRVERADTST